ncbi:MAG: hypothetical protein Q9222_007430 [Ikaeria aurantiellina]
MDSSSVLSMDVDSLVTALSRLLTNHAEKTRIEIQHDSLKEKEHQQKEEYARFSRYHDTFATMGEDQLRNLKAAEIAKDQSLKQLSQAKQANEELIRSFVQTILARKPQDSAPMPAPTNNGVTRRPDRGSNDDPAIVLLKEDMNMLRLSVVEAKSNHHEIKELASLQKKQAADTTALRHESNRRIADLSNQIKDLTSHVSKYNEFKKDLESLQTRKVDSFKAEIGDTLKKLENDIIGLNQKYESTASTPSYVSELKKSLALLQQSKIDSEHILDGLTGRVETTESCYATLNEIVEGVKRDFESQSPRLLEVKEQVDLQSASLQDLNSTCQQTMSKLQDFQETQKSAFQDMKQRFEHDVQISDGLQSRMQRLSSTCEEDRKMAKEWSEQGHNKQQELKSRMDLIERDSKEFQKSCLSHAQIVERDNSTKSLVSRAEFEDLSNTVAKNQKGEDSRDALVANEFEEVHGLLTQHESSREDLKVQITDQQKFLERLMSDQTTSSKSIQELAADFYTTKQHMERLQSEVSQLANQASQQPPYVNGIMDEYKPKIEALESDVRVFKQTNDKVIAIESFQIAQEQRLDNLTTEPIITTIFAKVQQTYPLHHVHGAINAVKNLNDTIAQLVSNVNTGRIEYLKRFDDVEKMVGDHSMSVAKLSSTVTEGSNQRSALKRKLEHVDSTAKAISDSREVDTQRLDTAVQSFDQLRISIEELKSNLDDLGRRYETNKPPRSDIIEQLEQSITNLVQDLKAAKEQTAEENRKLSESFEKKTQELEDRLAKEEKSNHELRRMLEESMQQSKPPPPAFQISSIIPTIYDQPELSTKKSQTSMTKSSGYVCPKVKEKSDPPLQGGEALFKERMNGSSQVIDKGEHCSTVSSTNPPFGLVNDIESLKNHMRVMKESMVTKFYKAQKATHKATKEQAEELRTLSKEVKSMEKKIESIETELAERVGDKSNTINGDSDRNTEQTVDDTREESNKVPENHTDSENDPDDPPIPLNRPIRPYRAFTSNKNPKKRSYLDQLGENDDGDYIDGSHPRSPQSTKRYSRNPSRQAESPASKRRGRPPKTFD